MKDKPYSKRVLSLQTFEGFLAAFQRQIKNFKTHKEAYYCIERRHYYYYGKEKYSSYESFASYMSKKNKSNIT